MIHENTRNRYSVNSTMIDDLTIQHPDDDALPSLMRSDLESKEATPNNRRSSLVIHKIPEENDRRMVPKVVSFHVDESNSVGDNDSQEKSASGLPLQLTNELCHDLWYQTPEIVAMKQDAKRVLFNRENADPDDLLGLERFNSQRAVWKRSAIYYVLLAQRQRHGEDFIRRVSQRCSAWARETAVRQGFADYCAVNDPLASLFGSKEENYNDWFFSEPSIGSSDSNHNNKKRKADEAEMESCCPGTVDGCNVRTKPTVTVERDEVCDEQVHLRA
jgi:hypothetical protein